MKPDEWRKYGYHVEKQRLVNSRGTIFRVFKGDDCLASLPDRKSVHQWMNERLLLSAFGETRKNE